MHTLCILAYFIKSACAPLSALLFFHRKIKFMGQQSRVQNYSYIQGIKGAIPCSFKRAPGPHDQLYNRICFDFIVRKRASFKQLFSKVQEPYKFYVG